MKEISIAPKHNGDFCMRILHIEDDSKFKLIENNGLKMYAANPIPKNRYGEEYEFEFYEDCVMKIEFVMMQYRIVCFDYQVKEAIDKLKAHILNNIGQHIEFLNNAQKEYKRKIRKKEIGKYDKNALF
jgi:hypothetical protein